MLPRWLTGVGWKLPVVAGVLYGPVLAIVLHFLDVHPFGGGVRGFALTAVFLSIGLALLLGFRLTRIKRLATQVADPSGNAARAVRAGADRTDPEVRAAARRLAVHRLDQHRRVIIFRPAGLSTLSALMLAGGIFSSHWLLLWLPLLGGLFALSRRQRAQLERRIAELSDEPTALST